MFFSIKCQLTIRFTSIFNYNLKRVTKEEKTQISSAFACPVEDFYCLIAIR